MEEEKGKQEKMNKAVFKEDPVKTYFSGEGCFINELFNEVNHSDGSIAKATVKPGMVTENHLGTLVYLIKRL